MMGKDWLKAILAFTLVAAVGASLWFSAPVKALTIQVTNPTATTLGINIPFDVTVTIEDTELLPIQSINLYIYYSDDRATYEVTLTDLPLSSGFKPYTNADTGGGDVDIVATADVSWAFGYGYGYTTWEGPPHYFGYGYGYGYGPGPAEITYSVTWDSPAGWPSGEYKIETQITAEGTTFTKLDPVTLTRPSGGGGGGGGGGGVDRSPPRFSDISASSITRTTADIYWETHEKSDSQVQYWSSPPMFSERDEELIYSHHVRLTALTPGTTYTYKTLSRDKSGNVGVSDELTFTTLGQAATFDVRLLDITPTEVNIGDQVTISIVVYNTGDSSGSYEVTLKIDNVAVATEKVSLAGGAGQKVTFTTSQDVAKTYSVDVQGLSGSFVVTAAAAPAPPPPVPPPPVLPPPTALINWWLIGGIIAGIVAMTMVVWLTVIRQRA